MAIYSPSLNSSNMLWSLAGNLALTNRILFGLNFEKDGLRISPFVPKTLAADRTLSDFPYRGARLNVTVKGYGDKVKSMTVDGKEFDIKNGTLIPAKKLKGNVDIVVTMADEPILSDED